MNTPGDNHHMTHAADTPPTAPRPTPPPPWRQVLTTTLAKHRKAAAAILGALLTLAAATYGTSPWIAVAITTATAYGVYQAPNRP